MLVLSNEDIEQIVTMPDCITVLEQLFRDMGEGTALLVPRVDNIAPCRHPDAYYAFKHMGGTWPARSIQARPVAINTTAP